MKRTLLILLAIPLAQGFSQTPTKMEKKKAVLVVHGGAGTILKKNMTEEIEASYEAKLTEALKAGFQVIQDKGTSTEAVTAAIAIMENSPLFNAGKGAVFTNDETNELDASIMEGEGKNAGAVSGVSTVKNPILLAKEVMVNSEHVMLSGSGASEFAEKQGLEIVDPDYFKTDKRKAQLERAKKKEKVELDHDGDRGEIPSDASEIEFNINLLPEDHKYGTVGAVALDQDGNLSAGTSTGGMTNKRYGRIGDSPIIAAGTYADNKTCGVSCTGHGEYFIRYAVAYDLHARMLYKKEELNNAANKIIHGTLKEAGGRGGLIALTTDGDYTLSFNTRGMYRGVIFEDGSVEVRIYDAEEK